MEFSSIITAAASEVLPSLIFKSLDNGTFLTRTYFHKYIGGMEFRISLSGLILIATNDGRFLLVESKKVKGKYQLPGGVYYHYNGWDDLNVLQKDDVLKNVPKADMRFKVRLGKEHKIKSILNKFETTTDREREPRREFKEELLKTKILPEDAFGDSRFNYRCTHKTNFEKTNGSKSEYCSFYRYEMFDLIMTDKQQKLIDDLANKAPIGPGYVFASSTDIKNGLSLSTGQFIQFPEYIKKLV